MTNQQTEKYLLVNENIREKLHNAFVRGILCQCTSSLKVFKIEPFKKLLAESMSLTVPNGILIPLLHLVNNTLMSVYGYAIAPINYGMKATILDNSSSIKELILVNVTNNPLVNEANTSTMSPEEQGKLFWTVCYLYLGNGSDVDKLKDHLRIITGESSTLINSYLDSWEKKRYIVLVKTKVNEGEIQRYEVGLRAFHEIGYQNITKFVSKMEGIEYTEEMVKKWLLDTLGQNQEEEKKEKTVTKPVTRRSKKNKNESDSE